MSRKEEIECFKQVAFALLGRNNIRVVATNCDIKKITNFFTSASPNKKKNDFPDFVFYNGGIEHFQITSSKETKKGSLFKIEENKNERIKNEYYVSLDKEIEKLDNNSSPVFVSNYENVYESFSYVDFVNSLKKNIINHVDSLIKANYQNKIVIFLMEQQTARLIIDDGAYPINFYKLSKDKYVLTIIKEICNYVDYLVYYVADAVEIIDLSKIDDLISNSVTYKSIKGGRLISNETRILRR